MRAINPKKMPVPEGARFWSRSTKRNGGMYHAHSLGFPICGARLVLDRHRSAHPESLGDMQWFGVCPRCYAKAMASPAKSDAEEA